MPSRSTIEVIYLLRRLIVRYKEKKEDLHIYIFCYIDLEGKKTYDRHGYQNHNPERRIVNDPNRCRISDIARSQVGSCGIVCMIVSGLQVRSCGVVCMNVSRIAEFIIFHFILNHPYLCFYFIFNRK